MGAFEAKDYFSSVPNLSLAATGGNTASGFGDGHSGRNIAIRGISGTNTTAMYLDETPLAEFVDPRLFDIARVEVLRGPQGTLYGSSTMGGAVKVITNQPNPSQTEGSFEAGIGKVKEGDLDYNVQGVYNIPFSKKAALRIGGFYDAKSGIFDRVKQTHYGTNADGAGGLPINSDWTTSGIELSAIPGTTGAGLEQTEAIKENIDDRTTYGLNVSLGLYPSENVSIVPKFLYQNHSQDGWEFADFRAGNFTQNRVAGIDETYDNEWWQASLSMDFDIGLGKLVSSTSFTKLDQQDTEDVSERQTLGPNPGGGGDFPDGLYAPEVLQRTGAYDRFVQELRLTSNTNTKFDYTVGLFYSNENNNADAFQQRDGYFNFWSNVLADIVPEVSEELGFLATQPFYLQDTDINTSEFSLFGEAYYKLSDKLTATFGLRYFNATQNFQQTLGGVVFDLVDGITDEKINESGINPKVSLSYDVNKNTLIYATAAKGFRLGGVAQRIPIQQCAVALDEVGLTESDLPTNFESDNLWNYELGLKTTSANGRFLFNAAAFYIDWQNLQQNVFLGLCGFGFTDNVGAARSIGFETDFKAKLSSAFEISGGLGINNAEIAEGSFLTGAEEGDRMQYVPKFTGNFTAQYTIPLGDNSVYIRGDLQHSGDRTASFDPENDPLRVFPSYTIINTRIAYQTPKYEVGLFVKNLTNEAANYGDLLSLAATPPGRLRYSTNRPTNVGLNFRVYF